MTRLLAACGLFSVVLTASFACARIGPATADPFPTRIETRVAPVSEASVPPLGASFRTTAGKHPRFFLEGDGWVPYALGAGLLLATDTVTLPFLQKLLGGSTTRDVSHSISYLGTPTVYMGTPLALYAFGGAHEKRAATKMANALITSGILTQLVKMATGRRRPNQSNGIGHFEGPGSDFGRSLGAHLGGFRHGDRSWVGVSTLQGALFALATAVAASRVFQNKHFPSDVVVGANWPLAGIRRCAAARTCWDSASSGAAKPGEASARKRGLSPGPFPAIHWSGCVWVLFRGQVSLCLGEARVDRNERQGSSRSPRSSRASAGRRAPRDRKSCRSVAEPVAQGLAQHVLVARRPCRRSTSSP